MFQMRYGRNTMTEQTIKSKGQTIKSKRQTIKSTNDRIDRLMFSQAVFKVGDKILCEYSTDVGCYSRRCIVTELFIKSDKLFYEIVYLEGILAGEKRVLEESKLEVEKQNDIED